MISTYKIDINFLYLMLLTIHRLPHYNVSILLSLWLLPYVIYALLFDGCPHLYEGFHLLLIGSYLFNSTPCVFQLITIFYVPVMLLYNLLDPQSFFPCSICRSHHPSTSIPWIDQQVLSPRLRYSQNCQISPQFLKIISSCGTMVYMSSFLKSFIFNINAPTITQRNCLVHFEVAIVVHFLGSTLPIIKARTKYQDWHKVRISTFNLRTWPNIRWVFWKHHGDVRLFPRPRDPEQKEKVVQVKGISRRKKAILWNCG